MSIRLRFFLVSAFLGFALFGKGWGIGFQPVNPDELKMTSEPKAPGAAAIILYREVDRDDNSLTSHEDNYLRIKILTEEGRKYADVEIRFLKQQGDIVNIHARTIRPDGSIANFGGQVFEKYIAKGQGVKYLAKTFTLPDVQVGSIIEYYYTIDLAEHFVFDSRWIISDELFTKSAKFTLKPYSGDTPMNLRWTWHALPTSAQPVQAPNHVVSLEVSDVPAFQTEDYMPPENELKARVDFIYSDESFESVPDRYWKRIGKKRNDQMESFVNKRKAMEQAVGEIVLPGEPANVEEVWKKQYAGGRDVTWLFLAFARAAGFEASGVWVSERMNYFFSPQILDGNRLDENVVLVKLNGKDLYFDPGSAFAPYGMLPWDETGVPGLKLDKDGGTWIQTTLPASAESTVRHKAELKLSETGDLEGKVTVTFTGLESSQRRLEERLADDTARKKSLEDEVKGSIPAACDVELTNQPDWKSSSTPLVAEFTLKVPGWVSGAGRRALLPVGLFSASEKHLFDHSGRVQPIYFSFPFQRTDDVSIDLPLGWQISSLPAPQKQDGHVVVYTLQAENNKGALHLSRTLNVDFLLLDSKYYGALRNFFQVVRTGDEQQVILQPEGAHASN
jgi:hypothetical protein